MPRSTKSLDEQLEEARKRVVDLARRKRLEDAERRRKERVRRLKQGELIARRWWARHDALAAADPGAAEREWQEVLADMDANLRVPSERRLFGLEPLDAGKAGAKEEPKPVRIWKADGKVCAETPHRSEVFATGIRTEFGGGWDKLAKRWYAAAEHYDQVVTLARRCYPKVVELEQPAG